MSLNNCIKNLSELHSFLMSAGTTVRLLKEGETLSPPHLSKPYRVISFYMYLPCKTIYLTFNFFELTGKWIFRQIVMFLTVEWTEMDEPLACTLHNTNEPFWYKKWSTTPSPIATCLVLNSDNFDSLLYICSNLKCRRNARQNPLPSSEYIKR